MVKGISFQIEVLENGLIIDILKNCILTFSWYILLVPFLVMTKGSREGSVRNNQTKNGLKVKRFAQIQKYREYVANRTPDWRPLQWQVWIQDLLKLWAKLKSSEPQKLEYASATLGSRTPQRPHDSSRSRKPQLIDKSEPETYRIIDL